MGFFYREKNYVGNNTKTQNDWSPVWSYQLVIYPTYWRVFHMLSMTPRKGKKKWIQYESRIVPLHMKMDMESLEKSHENLPRSLVWKPLQIAKIT